MPARKCAIESHIRGDESVQGAPKAMAERDDIGSRGEFIFSARIMAFCGRPRPYFRPYFLGAKAETIDFLVELVDAGDRTPYFFAQVRATQKGYTKKSPRRLKAGMSAADVELFALKPAPTYLIGVDEPGDIGFVVGILEGMKTAIPSIPTTFPLDSSTLPLLHNEVQQFWAGRNMAMAKTKFSL
jgi:hypothetical protein